jgi:hypothetical protein
MRKHSFLSKITESYCLKSEQAHTKRLLYHLSFGGALLGDQYQSSITSSILSAFSIPPTPRHPPATNPTSEV